VWPWWRWERPRGRSRRLLERRDQAGGLRVSCTANWHRQYSRLRPSSPLHPVSPLERRQHGTAKRRDDGYDRAQGPESPFCHVVPRLPRPRTPGPSRNQRDWCRDGVTAMVVTRMSFASSRASCVAISLRAHPVLSRAGSVDGEQRRASGATGANAFRAGSLTHRAWAGEAGGECRGLDEVVVPAGTRSSAGLGPDGGKIAIWSEL